MLAQVIQDVGLKPRLRWGPTATLVHQLPRIASRDSGTSFFQLANVRAGLRHRLRNAVRREDELTVGKFLARFPYAIPHGFDEQRVRTERWSLHDLRSSFHRRARTLNILGILTTSRIGSKCRRGESNRTLDARITHLTQGVGQHGMPIAIAPIDGHRHDFAQLFEQSSVLIVDGALAAEVIVVLGDRQHPFVRHILSAQNILKERNDILGLFRATKGNQQERVVGGHTSILTAKTFLN